MSIYWRSKGKFTCMNDCKQEGCPGHEMEVVYNGTSDTISVWLDGKVENCFDPQYLHELVLLCGDKLP